MPPENEIRQLVRENLLRFNEAIASKSFDAFYDSVSTHWQEQLTKGQLQRAFQPFMDQNISIANIANATPGRNRAIGSEGHNGTLVYLLESLVALGKSEERWKTQEAERSAAAHKEWEHQSARLLSQEAEKSRRLDATLAAEQERSKKLETALAQMNSRKVKMGHPATQITNFAKMLGAAPDLPWYD